MEKSEVTIGPKKPIHICINCYNCKIKNYLFYKKYICKLTTCSTISKITGKVVLYLMSCKDQRDGDPNAGFCGPEGTKFRPYILV